MFTSNRNSTLYMRDTGIYTAHSLLQSLSQWCLSDVSIWWLGWWRKVILVLMARSLKMLSSTILDGTALPPRCAPDPVTWLSAPQPLNDHTEESPCLLTPMRCFTTPAGTGLPTASSKHKPVWMQENRWKITHQIMLFFFSFAWGSRLCASLSSGLACRWFSNGSRASYPAVA